MRPCEFRASLTPEEYSLVLQAQQFRERFGTQAAAHRTYLEHLCAKLLQNPSDVEEVVGETLYKALRIAATYDGRASLKTWLFSIAENECCMKLRKQRGKVEGAVCFSQFGGGGESADEAVDVVSNLPDQSPSVEERVIEPIAAESTWASVMQKAAGKWKMIDYKLFALRTVKSTHGTEPVMTFPEIADLLDANANTLRSRWKSHIKPVLQRAIDDDAANLMSTRK